MSSFLQGNKIKRKNFLILAGSFTAGAYLISKIPFGIFAKKKNQGKNNNGISIKLNPESVKRIS